MEKQSTPILFIIASIAPFVIIGYMVYKVIYLPIILIEGVFIGKERFRNRLISFLEFKVK